MSTASKQHQSQERFDKEAARVAAQHAAALRGAALAFGNGKKKPAVKPKPETYAGTDGALAAASKVGWSSGNREKVGGSADVYGGSRMGENGAVKDGRNVYTQIHRGGRGEATGNTNGLLKPEEQGRSASHIAANLAASRSPSVSPNVTGHSRQYTGSGSGEATRRGPSPLKLSGSERSASVRSGQSDERSLDSTSIPTTTSLIDMFESNKDMGGDGAALAAAKKSVKSSNGQRAASPICQRPASVAAARISTRADLEQVQEYSISPKSQEPASQLAPETAPVKIRAKTPPLQHRVPEPSTRVQPNSTFAQIVTPASPRPKASKSEVVTLHPPNSQRLSISSPASTSGQNNRTEKPLATTISAPGPQPVPRPHQEEDGSSDDSFVSASDYRPSFRAELQNQRRARMNSTSNNSIKSSVTVDSLANAIVASSLASSRATSPSRNLRAPAPPPSRRSTRSHHLFHSEPSRSASPVKPTGLRTTMRAPKSEEEVDEGAKRRLKKAHLMKKHPNKHHEGDRKRWRDEITERERKRYEAVWASNKGLYLPSTPDAETSVCSLVVRDIWSRSKLHADVLEEAYALVDRQHIGMLGKEEFVVGLWLVDQRLKGRKLPIRVSESVWRSVGNLRDIKVVDYRKDKKKKKR